MAEEKGELVHLSREEVSPFATLDSNQLNSVDKTGELKARVLGKRMHSQQISTVNAHLERPFGARRPFGRPKGPGRSAPSDRNLQLNHIIGKQPGEHNADRQIL